MEKILEDIKTIKDLPPEEKVERARAIIQQCCALPDLELNEVRKALKAVEISKKSVDQELRKAKNRNKNSGTQGASTAIEILHGAIDFPDHSIVLGFRVMEAAQNGDVVEMVQCLFKNTYRWEVQAGRNLLLINGRRYAIDPTSCPPFLSDRWSSNHLQAFLKSPTYPNGVELFEGVTGILEKYVELQRKGQYYLVSLWIVASYVAHLFSAFPFLFFFGPKESGKSRILELLELLCFNAVKTKDLSAAALGDTVEGERGTILVDQAEKMQDRLVGLLADSYRKRGGRRRVVETEQGKRRVLEFKTYGPKAFAAIREIDPDLLDRCIRIPTLKALRPYPDFLGSEPEWLPVRDNLYRWTLQRYSTATDAYKAIAPTGTRRGELWRPLESMAVALNLDEDILNQAKTAFDSGTEGTRYHPEDDELDLFDYLKEEGKTKVKPFVLEMPKMTDAMLLKLDGINKTNPLTTDQQTLKTQENRRAKWIGDTIKKFSLGTQLSRKGRGKIRRYEFDPACINDMYDRYVNS